MCQKKLIIAREISKLNFHQDDLFNNFLHDEYADKNSEMLKILNMLWNSVNKTFYKSAVTI